MTKAKLARVIGFVASVLIATACSRQDGQATFDYLKAQLQIVEEGTRSMKDHHIPKPPAAPTFTKQTKPRERLTLIRQYRDSADQYYADIIQVSRVSETVLNHVQNQLSVQSGAGVERDAILFATLQEQALGDAVQMRIKLRAWATRAQEDMHKPHARNVMIPHLVLGVVELMEGSPLGLGQIGKGITEQAKVNSERSQENEAEQMHVDDSLAALEDARTTLASDMAALHTKRNQLITRLGAQYPDFAWKLIFSRKSQTEAPANAH